MDSTNREYQRQNSSMTRRKSLEHSNISTKGILQLPKNAQGTKNIGFDPSKILKSYYRELTQHERSEIMNHKSIYFIGNKGVEKFNGRFCSKKGIYRGLTGDHLKYRYEIIKELGRGSFGIVFECWDHKKSEEVAIKIIKCKAKYRKAGEFESFLLDRIQEEDPSDNNCFVKKHKTFEFRQHMCIVFELLYCTLYNFLKEKDFTGIDTMLVKRITLQLLQGLKQLHSIHYLHCDLKPDNIMLKYKNKSKIKIIDVGSAVYSFYKDVPRYVQTRYYRAPEVILGINYDYKIDYWSLGCVVVELLLGMTLFYAENEEELLYKIVSLIGEPPPHLLRRARKGDLYFIGNQLKYPERVIRRSIQELLVSVNHNCVDFIVECLTWDPAERMNSEKGLNHPWIRERNNRYS